MKSKRGGNNTLLFPYISMTFVSQNENLVLNMSFKL